MQKGLKGHEQKGKDRDNRKGKENLRESHELEIRMRALTRTNTHFQNEIAEFKHEIQLESRQQSKLLSSSEFKATLQGMVDSTLAVQNRLTEDILQISEL